MPFGEMKVSVAGIITDESGERHIPESVRADGTTRKAIKIKPGYRPPEDVEVYKNRTAEGFRSRGKGGVVGAEGLTETQGDSPSASSNKNAKRREARRKAKSVGESQDGPVAGKSQDDGPDAKSEVVDPEAEKEKKARNLKKRLKQARDLKGKKDDGQSLLPEQIAKVIKIKELVRELEALGFDADGEPETSASSSAPKTTVAGWE